jgi:hypothetical protein
MSKRSKRSSVGRDFAKQEPDILTQSEAILGFSVTMSAFRLAAEKLAALEPSKTAEEWVDCLIKEATEQAVASETVEMFEGWPTSKRLGTRMIENTSPISSSLSSVVKIAR